MYAHICNNYIITNGLFYTLLNRVNILLYISSFHMEHTSFFFKLVYIGNRILRKPVDKAKLKNNYFSNTYCFKNFKMHIFKVILETCHHDNYCPKCLKLH